MVAVGETKCLSKGSPQPKIDNKKLTVYSMRMCPYAERVRLTLNLKHIPYDVINIDLKDKPEWFLQINPLGQVPAVQTPGRDAAVHESIVCAEYLDDSFSGDRTFLPKDDFERARQKAVIEVVAQKFTKHMTNLRYDKDADAGKKMLEGLDEMDKLLVKDYFAGDQMGFVDLMVWPWFERLESAKEAFNLPEISSKRYPNVMAFCDRMMADPDIKSTTYPQTVFVDFFRSALAGKPDWDVGL